MDIYNLTDLHFTAGEISQMRNHITAHMVASNDAREVERATVMHTQEGGFVVIPRFQAGGATVHFPLASIFPAKQTTPKLVGILENPATGQVHSVYEKCAPNASVPCYQCGNPVGPGRRLKVSLDILEDIADEEDHRRIYIGQRKPVVVCNYRCLVAMILPPTL